jgi:hypothetical protein
MSPLLILVLTRHSLAPFLYSNSFPFTFMSFKKNLDITYERKRVICQWIPLISSVILWSFKSVLFNLHVFLYSFDSFFSNWFLVLFHYDLIRYKMLFWFFYLLRFALCHLLVAYVCNTGGLCLPTWEAEIKRITVQGQPRKIVCKSPFPK